MRINLDLIGDDSLEAIDTIAHEMWHIYQHQCADDHDSEVGKVYNKNFNSYVKSADDSVGYRLQPVEEEARRFAEQFKDYVQSLENKLKGMGE